MKIQYLSRKYGSSPTRRQSSQKNVLKCEPKLNLKCYYCRLHPPRSRQKEMCKNLYLDTTFINSGSGNR